MRIASLALVLTAAATTAATAAPSADDVVAKMQGYYKKVPHLKGEFRQDVADPTFGTKRKSHGTIELARPGKFRMDYANTTGAGVKKSIRTDGKHLWDVEHDNKEIITRDIAKDPTPAAVGVLTGADLSKDFTAKIATNSGFGDDKSTVIELDPKQPSAAYKQVFIVVDPKDGRVLETAVVDTSDNVGHFVFDKLDPNAAVKDSDFIVDPDAKDLKQYRLVDADQQQKPVTDK